MVKNGGKRHKNSASEASRAVDWGGGKGGVLAPPLDCRSARFARRLFYCGARSQVASPADILRRASRVPSRGEGTRDARLRMSAGEARSQATHHCV